MLTGRDVGEMEYFQPERNEQRVLKSKLSSGGKRAQLLEDTSVEASKHLEDPATWTQTECDSSQSKWAAKTKQKKGKRGTIVSLVWRVCEQLICKRYYRSGATSAEKGNVPPSRRAQTSWWWCIIQIQRPGHWEGSKTNTTKVSKCTHILMYPYPTIL